MDTAHHHQEHRAAQTHPLQRMDKTVCTSNHLAQTHPQLMNRDLTDRRQVFSRPRRANEIQPSRPHSRHHETGMKSRQPGPIDERINTEHAAASTRIRFCKIKNNLFWTKTQLKSIWTRISGERIASKHAYLKCNQHHHSTLHTIKIISSPHFITYQKTSSQSKANA